MKLAVRFQYTHTHILPGGHPGLGHTASPWQINGPVDIRKHTETETTSDRRRDLGLAVHLLSPQFNPGTSKAMGGGAVWLKLSLGSLGSIPGLAWSPKASPASEKNRGVILMLDPLPASPSPPQNGGLSLTPMNKGCAPPKMNFAFYADFPLKPTNKKSTKKSGGGRGPTKRHSQVNREPTWRQTSPRRTLWAP